MLKISEGKRGRQSITLQLEGRIVGPWVSELDEACGRFVRNGHKLTLNLSEVAFADENGVALLGQLRTGGVRLLNPSPFMKAQLKTSQSAGKR